jgi:hypothetical protein
MLRQNCFAVYVSARPRPEGRERFGEHLPSAAGSFEAVAELCAHDASEFRSAMVRVEHAQNRELQFVDVNVGEVEPGGSRHGCASYNGGGGRQAGTSGCVGNTCCRRGWCCSMVDPRLKFAFMQLVLARDPVEDRERPTAEIVLGPPTRLRIVSAFVVAPDFLDQHILIS